MPFQTPQFGFFQKQSVPTRESILLIPYGISWSEEVQDKAEEDSD